MRQAYRAKSLSSTVNLLCWICGLLAIGVMTTINVVRAQVPESGVDQNSSNRWPMRIDTDAGTVTVYQPQLVNFEGEKLTARAAVSVIPRGQDNPIFGAIWMDSRVSTDRVARTVQILDVTVTKSRFPDASGTNGTPSEQSLTDALRSTLPKQPMTLSLDQLLAMLENVQKEKENAKNLSTDVPHILFKDHASVLVQFDGDPRLSPVENSPLMRAANTPFFVVFDPQAKTYFLKGGGQWFAAPNPLGPYQTANGVPQSVGALADSSGYKDPENALSPAQAAGIEIVTATEPSELIWTDGPEQMMTLGDTNLLYVSNTDCDIFLHIDSQTIYVLASGRWFSAPHRTGPWAYVPADKLPADFHAIPKDSAKGDVLAHVAGTQEAKDAVADTFVPQTAAIDRQHYDPPTVQYDGEPSFEPVENTSCSYAVNTSESVVLVEHRYYCCSRAVWYTSEAAVGPWVLCTSVPQVVYTLPPSCPIYPCRYVYVYDVTPDVVYCGYLPGYVGCYHYDGVVVYGTGYHYRPWIGHEYFYRPCTYGYGARYDDDRNCWGFSVGLFFGSGNAWIGHHDEDHDRYWHDDHWFGHGGFRETINTHERNINNYHTNITNVHNVTINRTEYNVYEKRHDVHRDANDRPEVRTPVHHEPDVKPNKNTPVAHDNVFADKNGNVYRKTLDGWERRDNNRWVDSSRVDSSGNDHADRTAHVDQPNPPHDVHVDQPKVPHDAHTEQPKVDHPDVTPDKPVRDRPPQHVETPPTPHDDAKPDRHVDKPADKPAEPADRGDLNRDYRARVAGEERARQRNEPPQHVTEPPPPPHDQPKHSDAGDSGRSEPPKHNVEPPPRQPDPPAKGGGGGSGNDPNSGSSSGSGKKHN